MKKLTKAQKKLIELDEYKPFIKQYFQELDTTLATLAFEQGLSVGFQDKTGATYKIIRPKGKFVFFREFDYMKTK